MVKRIIFIIAIVPAVFFSLTLQALFECFYWLFTARAHPPIFIKLIDWVQGTKVYEEWSKMYEA